MGHSQTLQQNVEIQQRGPEQVAVVTVGEKHFFHRFNGYTLGETTLDALSDRNITTIIVDEEHGDQYQFDLEQYRNAPEWYRTDQDTAHVASLDEGQILG